MNPTSTAIGSLGAVVHNDGVAFGVWAPHAGEVSVVGKFNNWDRSLNPCEQDESGNWFAFVQDAKPGQGYKFWIRNGENECHRISRSRSFKFSRKRDHHGQTAGEGGANNR
jgi:1,4-alpha-glucan branching enzyme